MSNNFHTHFISEILKLTRLSLRPKFVLKNYTLSHYIGSFIWFVLSNLELIIFDQLVSHTITTGAGSEEFYRV